MQASGAGLTDLDVSREEHRVESRICLSKQPGVRASKKQRHRMHHAHAEKGEEKRSATHPHDPLSHVCAVLRSVDSAVFVFQTRQESSQSQRNEEEYSAGTRKCWNEQRDTGYVEENRSALENRYLLEASQVSGKERVKCLEKNCAHDSYTMGRDFLTPLSSVRPGI